MYGNYHFLRYSSEECSFSVDPLRVNDHLKSGRRLFESEIIGPEAFAVNKNGTCTVAKYERSFSGGHTWN